MKNKIPEFLQAKFLVKAPRPTSFPEHIKQFMNDYNDFYNFNRKDEFLIIFKAIKKGVAEN